MFDIESLCKIFFDSKLFKAAAYKIYNLLLKKFLIEILINTFIWI